MRLYSRMVGLAIASICGIVAAADDFRLAGTMSYGQGQWLAVVEASDGQQRLVRVNEPLGEGTVIAIGDRTVRVRHPEGDRLYVLEGGRTIATWVAPARPEGAPIVASREAPGDLLNALALMRARLGSTSTEVLHADLNRLLGIPPSARVRAVGQSQMTSDRQVIETIERHLRSRSVVHLFLEASPQLTEVYLLPPLPKTTTASPSG